MPDQPMTIERAREVLQDTHKCAVAWEPGVRLLGNVRAGDMAQALTTLLAYAKARDEDVERAFASGYAAGFRRADDGKISDEECAWEAYRTAFGGTP